MLFNEPISFGAFILFSILGSAVFAAYMMPTILAAIAKEKNLPVVMMINFFFGWTIVGYVVAIGLAGFFADPGERREIEVHA